MAYAAMMHDHICVLIICNQTAGKCLRHAEATHHCTWPIQQNPDSFHDMQIKLKTTDFGNLVRCHTSLWSHTWWCTTKHLVVHVRISGETKLPLKGISMLPRILTTCIAKVFAMIRLMAITRRHRQARPRQIINGTRQQM